MKAIVHLGYGSVAIGEIARPAPAAGEVLVRVRAAALNAMDAYFFSGKPYLVRVMMGRKPRPTGVLVADFAGVVEEAGANVSEVRPGDEVFGARRGAGAEFLAAPVTVLAPKPSNVGFDEAAAVPVAGLTALQGLRDHGRIRPGQRVLVHGAAGGVGTFAVQIAKALGSEVTGVCSTGNVERVRSLGADHVIDYTREDFTRGERRFDLMLDVAGGRRWSECRRVLVPGARVVMAGGPRTSSWFGPLGHLVGFRLGATGSGHPVTSFVARIERGDLLVLKEMIEAGRVRPVVDRSYALGDAGEAFAYLGSGRPRAKVVIRVAEGARRDEPVSDSGAKLQ